MGIGELLLNGTAEILDTNNSSAITFKQDIRVIKIKELINHLDNEFSFRDATYNEKLLYRTLMELLETF